MSQTFGAQLEMFRLTKGLRSKHLAAAQSFWDLRGLLDDVDGADWTLMHELLNHAVAIEDISYTRSVRHKQLSLFEGVE